MDTKKVLIELASKYFIVVTFAVGTTIIQLAFMTTMAETTLVAYDQIINSFCVMMLLPYYPDEIYYNNLCCCFSIPLNRCIFRSKINYGPNSTEIQIVNHLHIQKVNSNKQNYGEPTALTIHSQTGNEPTMTQNEGHNPPNRVTFSETVALKNDQLIQITLAENELVKHDVTSGNIVPTVQ